MAPQNSQEKMVQRHVYVQEFLKDDKGQVTGVRGMTWPDRVPVALVLDNDCAKAKNEKRMTFAKLAKGFNASGRKHKLEPGAILRVRTWPAEGESAGPGVLSLKTDWINPVTYNSNDTGERIRFGLVMGEMYSQDAVREKHAEISNSPEMRQWMAGETEKRGRTPSHHEIYQEIERRLAAEMPGARRYSGFYRVYEPENVASAFTREDLKSVLSNYFNDPAFAVQTSDDDRPYRAIRPHLIVRGLNENGEFNGIRAEFNPKDAAFIPKDEDGNDLVEQKRFLTPEECVNDIMNSMPDCHGYSVLPARVYAQSVLLMEMNGEKQNIYAQQKLCALARDCNPDADKDIPNERKRRVAFQMGLRLSTSDDRPCVTETLRDFRVPAVDPSLVAGVEKSQTPGVLDRFIFLKPAPELMNRTEEREEESAGPTP